MPAKAALSSRCQATVLTWMRIQCVKPSRRRSGCSVARPGPRLGGRNRRARTCTGWTSGSRSGGAPHRATAEDPPGLGI